MGRLGSFDFSALDVITPPFNFDVLTQLLGNLLIRYHEPHRIHQRWVTGCSTGNFAAQVIDRMCYPFAPNLSFPIGIEHRDR
ncbi:MAG: hypothetical protein CM1200mP18_14560 [Gammaproteobacteria bacterium]|nr:MAG: hypothetical protein CM1200mP18_14560 [Gammaproteobacteria bacterium]